MKLFLIIALASPIRCTSTWHRSRLESVARDSSFQATSPYLRHHSSASDEDSFEIQPYRLNFDDEDIVVSRFNDLQIDQSSTPFDPFEVLGLHEGTPPSLIKPAYAIALKQDPTRNLRMAYYTLTQDLEGFFDGIAMQFLIQAIPTSKWQSKTASLDFLLYALTLETGQDDDSILRDLTMKQKKEYLLRAWERTVKVAVKKERCTFTRVLVASGISLDRKDEIGRSAVFYVSDPEILTTLLQSGRLDLSIRDINGDSPLHILAARRRNSEVLLSILIRYYIEHGLDLNSQNIRRQTPLHVALLFENVLAAEMFLESVDPAILDENEDDALILAASVGGMSGVIEKLLSKGSDPRWPNKLGQTALHVAVKACFPEYLTILLGNPLTSLTSQDGNGETVFHYLCRNAVSPYTAEMMDLLLDAAISRKLQNVFGLENNDGYLALHFAIINGHVRMVRDLLLLRAVFDSKSELMTQSLSLAYEKGHYEIVKMVLEYQVSGWVNSAIFNRNVFVEKRTFFDIYLPHTNDSLDLFNNALDSFRLGQRAVFNDDHQEDILEKSRHISLEIFGPQSIYFARFNEGRSVQIRQHQARIRDYKLIGEIIGLAIINKVALNVTFTTSLLKGLLCLPLTAADLAEWNKDAINEINELRYIIGL